MASRGKNKYLLLELLYATPPPSGVLCVVWLFKEEVGTVSLARPETYQPQGLSTGEGAGSEPHWVHAVVGICTLCVCTASHPQNGQQQ